MKKCIVSTIYNRIKSEDSRLSNACRDYLFPNGQPLLKLKAIEILKEIDCMVRIGYIQPVHYELVLRQCSEMSGYSVTELEIFKDFQDEDNFSVIEEQGLNEVIEEQNNNGIKDLINEKYGVEIKINHETIDGDRIDFTVKESKRSKKLKHRYTNKGYEHIQQYFTRLVQFEIEEAERKEKRKHEQKQAKIKFLEQLKPGTILYDSWGYDQTNVYFYEVIEVKGSKVTIQELNNKQAASAGNSMACYVVPGEKSDREPTTHTVRSERIRLCSSVSLGLWDGEKKYCSWYA